MLWDFVGYYVHKTNIIIVLIISLCPAFAVASLCGRDVFEVLFGFIVVGIGAFFKYFWKLVKKDRE